jgi:hypothetical protein
VTAVDPDPGGLVTKSRPVQGFTGVSVGFAGRLIIEQGGAESLEITAGEHILPLIRSEVVGDQLILGLRPDVRLGTSHEIVYRLTVRDLTAIEASGASRVEAHGLRTPALATVFSGASSFTASGRADHHVMVLSGASHCDAPDLRSHSVIATVSGASYALVSVSQALTAVASGGSTVEYFGDPVVAMTVSGGSLVRRVGP